MVRLLFLVVICIFITEQQSHAYIDPASGSMIMQVIIAAIGVIGYSLSVFWGKIKKLCEKNDKK